MTQYLRDFKDTIVSALKGMRITIRHVVRKPVTLQYPDERWVLPERFKGFVVNDTNLCDGCLRCAKVCPVDCIYIEMTGKAKERFMWRYAIDYNKCIWCGLCTLECPTGACQHSLDYDQALYDRKRLVYEFVDPKQPIPCHKELRLHMGFFVPNAEEELAKLEARREAEKRKAEASPQDAAAEDAPPTPENGKDG